VRRGRAPLRPGLIAEEEDQVDARPLDAALADAVCGTGGLGRGRGLHTQEIAQRIVEQELGDAPLAELLPQAEERAIAYLLAERQPGPQVAVFGGGGDLEQVEVEGTADRFAEWRGDEAGGDTAACSTAPAAAPWRCPAPRRAR
jgi:hypothetical protein